MTIVHPPLVHLDLRDDTVRMALSHACDQAGWARSSSPSAHAAAVADQVVTVLHRPLDALVVEPTPAASRMALDAFTSGRALAVVASTEPHTLPRALELARAGYGVIPRSVIEAADRLPVITPRLERVLQLILRGSTNATISRALHQSLSSTKRDVAALLRLFDAPNRQALVPSALRMGIRPRGGL